MRHRLLDYTISMKGIIIVNKPKGLTSMDVIRVIRRLTGEKRVGHSGTLDPMATGVLPVFIGREMTRQISKYMEGKKGYLAEMTLGVETDTGDAEGKILNTKFETLNKSKFSKLKIQNQLQTILNEFVGEIEQVPPMYSAIHHEGKRLYELAREGKEVERKPRKVTIYEIKFINYKEEEYPKVTFECLCSKGTYIRSLAVDLGQRLGCGAHLSALTRIYSEPFSLKETHSLEEIEDCFLKNQENRLFIL